MTLRVLVVAAVVLAGGCVDPAVDANRPVTGNVLAGSGPLTKEQTSDWKALCRRMRNNHQDGLRLAAVTLDWHWQVRYLFYDSEKLNSEYAWQLAPGSGLDETTVRKTAFEYASRAQFRCTAVLDLFGGDEPRFVAWYAYDGKSVREYQAAPTAEIADSAGQYLLEVQRRARDLR